jgi:hypothetical protein
MIRINQLFAATLIAVSAAAPIIAQGPTPNACAAPDRHKFDFWIGEWEVKVSAGATVGKSSVQPIAGGCGMLENWTASAGGSGKSLNAYNPVSKQWQQFWVGQGGAVTEYRESTWTDGTISFIARGSVSGAGPIQRLSFTPMNDTTVRQHGEQSADNGATWTTTYDFFYYRRR